MGKVRDLWDDITGKTAQKEARKQAREDQIKAENNAARARVFAETEGKGQGSVGKVSLGLDDEAEDGVVDKQKNIYL